MDKKKITDETLVAYLDGELDPSETGAIEDFLASSSEARERVEDLKKINTILRNVADEIAAEPLPEKINALIQKKKKEEKQASNKQHLKQKDTNLLESIQSFFQSLATPLPQMAMVATSLLLGVYIGLNSLESNEFNLEPGNYELMVTRGANSIDKLIPIIEIILQEKRQTSSVVEGDQEYTVNLNEEFKSSNNQQCLIGEIKDAVATKSNFFIGCLNDTNTWDITFTPTE